MGLFWKRKSKDQFVTLGLNEPRTADSLPPEIPKVAPSEGTSAPPTKVDQTELSGSTFIQRPQQQATSPKTAAVEVAQKPIPARSPFQTSVLGLNLSIEELQAQEAALEQELSARFRRAVAATRESLSEKLDTVFQGRKQIDEDLLDELEEALIATDIGVPTTLEILDNVRRGIARKSINDLAALKQAIKDELLRILRASEAQGSV